MLLVSVHFASSQSHTSGTMCKKDDYVGNGITEKFAKLRCIQGVCSLNRSEKVCRMLEECEAKKKTEGLFSFIGCIIKLFS